MSFRGIDVSRHQKEIDWAKVKASQIEFALIKAGGSDDGFYVDSCFETNYAEAKRVGMPIGVYYFVGIDCNSKANGEADAYRFLDMLKGKTFEYPVYIDVEATRPSEKDGVTEATIAFCKVVENAGYYVGIYASDISGFHDRLNLSALDKFDKWVARYGSEPKYVLNYGVFQDSSSGSIDGIVGNVDTNIAYKDYPSIIKNAGLNGFTNAQPIPQPEPVAPVPQPAPIPVPVLPAHTFNVGEMVKPKAGSKSYEGATIAEWVFAEKVYSIDELHGDRAVLSEKTINTAFNVRDLIYVGPGETQTTSAAPSPKRTYTILPGESFCRISAKIYGTESRAADIASANGMTLQSVIYAGKTLVLPD